MLSVSVGEFAAVVYCTTDSCGTGLEWLLVTAVAVVVRPQTPPCAYLTAQPTRSEQAREEITATKHPTLPYPPTCTNFGSKKEDWTTNHN